MMLSLLTVGCVPLGWGSILEDDRHEGLANGALPRLGHLTAHAAIGRHVAGGGGSGRLALGMAGGLGGDRGVGVLAYKVAHGACDYLEAVRVGARGNQGEVTGGTHLQNLRQRNLLQVESYSKCYYQPLSLVVLHYVMISRSNQV